MEKHKRTLMKTLSWRVAATSTTVLLVFLFTKNIAISAGVSLAEMIFKTIIYYIHERFWNTIKYARVPITEDEKLYYARAQKINEN